MKNHLLFSAGPVRSDDTQLATMVAASRALLTTSGSLLNFKVKAVVYTSSPNYLSVLSGLWRDVPHKISHKITTTGLPVFVGEADTQMQAFKSHWSRPCAPNTRPPPRQGHCALLCAAPVCSDRLRGRLQGAGEDAPPILIATHCCFHTQAPLSLLPPQGCAPGHTPKPRCVTSINQRERSSILLFVHTFILPCCSYTVLIHPSSALPAQPPRVHILHQQGTRPVLAVAQAVV